MQPMENFDKAHWDRLVESMTPKATSLENKTFFPDIGDDKLSLTTTSNINNNNRQQYIPPIPPKKISMTSSNDGDYDSNDTQQTPKVKSANSLHINNKQQLIPHPSSDTQDSEAADDPTELNAMRDQLFGLVSQEAQSRGMHIDIPSNGLNVKYGDDPKANELITLYNQQSLQNVIQSITTPAPQTNNISQQNNNSTRSSTPTPRNQQQQQSAVLSPVSLPQNQPSPQNSHSQVSSSRATNIPPMQSQESHGHSISPMQTQQSHSMPPMQTQSSHSVLPMQSQQSHPHSMQPIQAQQSHHSVQQMQAQQSRVSVHQQSHSVQSMPPQPMQVQQSRVSVHQQSHSVQSQPGFEQQGTIHPAVQKLYDLQQELLRKLVLLEKDDPDPQSAKLWGIMQRIFTEENAQQRQQNIADLTSTLEEKHKEVQEMNESGDNNLSISDQRLLRSIHEMSKETKNELKEMRQQLNEERKKNNELRSKIRKKNRQLKVLSSEINSNNDDENNLNYSIAPMAFDPNVFDSKARGGGMRQTVSLDEESVSSYGFVDGGKKQPSSFQKFCINMGFQPSEKKCSWF